MKMPRWLRAIVIGVALLVALSFAFSRALRASAARRYLTAHLAASFGRPVEVSWFDFSLLDGARIEAHAVTVSEDPHFGSEYFLRSDTLTAGLRWRSLLAGRFEFGSVSLSRPSLNLVRDATGRWNIERWLPPAPPPGSPPGFVGPVAPLPEVRATRPMRIDIDDGRINFKRGDNKVPFALVNVSGRIDQNSPGRWQLDLEARPMRAGVELQDIGTMQLHGSIAGTTARLQPAELALTWRAASLADALRLASQNDYGMRGELAVDLNARIAPAAASSGVTAPSAAQWSLSGVARLTGMHGWALPARGSDPAANLSIDMDWRLGEPRVQIRRLLVQMASSHVEGNGDVDWARGIHPEFQIASSTLGLGDVLACYRALHPNVAEDLQASGTLGLDLKLGGWPMELQVGAISSSGGTVTGTSLPGPLRIGEMHASVARGKIDISATELAFRPALEGTGSGTTQAAGSPRNALVVRGSLSPQVNGAFRWPPDWNFSVEGATARAQDWLALAAVLAQPVNSGWTASGGVAVKMRGERRADSSAPPWIGTVDFLALTLNPSYVNQPVVFPKAHVEFAPTQRTITLSSAAAFGATWRGSITRKYPETQWSFDLTADSLDAVELDRWLGPRARPGFLARMIGSNDGGSDSGAAPPNLADAFVTRLAARGRLRAGAIALPPMHIEKFDGQTELDGRTIRIRGAQGDFFGGKISGSLEAQLVPNPSYDFQGHFDRIDLALLGRSVPSLSGRIAGIASATLVLSAHGIGRQDLINSIEGQGNLNGKNVSLRGIDLSSVASGTSAPVLADTFAALQGTYSIRNRSVDFVDVLLQSPEGRLEADGRVDFSHALNIRIHPFSIDSTPTLAADSPPSFLLGGTIESPNLFLASAAGKPPARPGSR